MRTIQKLFGIVNCDKEGDRVTSAQQSIAAEVRSETHPSAAVYADATATLRDTAKWLMATWSTVAAAVAGLGGLRLGSIRGLATREMVICTFLLTWTLSVLLWLVFQASRIASADLVTAADVVRRVFKDGQQSGQDDEVSADDGLAYSQNRLVAAMDRVRLLRFHGDPETVLVALSDQGSADGAALNLVASFATNWEVRRRFKRFVWRDVVVLGTTALLAGATAIYVAESALRSPRLPPVRVSLYIATDEEARVLQDLKCTQIPSEDWWLVEGDLWDGFIVHDPTQQCKTVLRLHLENGRSAIPAGPVPAAAPPAGTSTAGP
jgi:hypothetical protein